MRILSKILIFGIFFCPGIALSMDFQEGFSDWVRTNCTAKGYHFKEELLQSHPGSLSNFMRNMRFFGNMTHLFDENNSPHHQSLSNEMIYCFPADALTALMGHLFPSPDGELFIANQTGGGDPIGKLNPQRVGYILRLIEDTDALQDPKTEEVLKLTIFEVLSRSDYDVYSEKSVLPVEGRREKYESLLAKYAEFCTHDFKAALLKKLKKLLHEMSEEELKEKLNTDRTDPSIFTKYLKYSLAKTPSEEEFFQRGDLKEGELEAYHQVATLQDTTSPLATKMRWFKNKEQDFKTLRFVEILVNAQKEQHFSSVLGSSLSVEKGIFFFFWQKAKSQRDFVEFLSGYLRASPESLIPFQGTVFTEKTYWDIRNDPQSLKGNLTHAEHAFLLSQGYDAFENPLPFMRQYQTAFYEGKSFPDCVEVMTSNFLDIISRMKREDSSSREKLQGYEMTLEHILPADHPLNLYYAWFTAHPELQFSQERRNRIAELCSRLPHIRYLKSTHGKEGEKDYELAPGFINFLNLLRALFQDPKYIEELPFEENIACFTTELQRLCTVMSRGDKFKLSVDAKDMKYLSFQGKDYFGELSFLVNDQKAFRMVMSHLHGIIKPEINREGDWRRKADIKTLGEALPPETLASFVTQETLEELFSTLPRDKYQHLVQCLDLEDLEMKLEVIKTVFTHTPSLKPLAKALIRTVMSFEDSYTENALMKSLLSLYEAHHFSDLEMENVLGEFPELLDCQIEVPDPRGFSLFIRLSLYAFEQGKFSWLKTALPKVNSLQFQWDTDKNREMFLEFLKTQLPTCVNLKRLSFGTTLMEKEELFLCSTLASLRNLKELSVSFSSVQHLIASLPASLEKFSTWVNLNLKDEASVKMFQSFKPILHDFVQRYPLKQLKLWMNIQDGEDLYKKSSERNKPVVLELLDACHIPEKMFYLSF